MLDIRRTPSSDNSSRNVLRFRTELVLFAWMLLGSLILVYPNNMAGAEQTVDLWLNTILDKASTKVRPQRTEQISNEYLRDVFPEDKFYSIVFATWPRAPGLPQELSLQMIARVRGSSIEPIRNSDDLTKYLAATLPQARGDDRLRAILLASLRLAEAISKAAAYEFGDPVVSVVRGASNIETMASAPASEPARGDITISMQFAVEGAVLPNSIHLVDRTRAGPPSQR